MKQIIKSFFDNDFYKLTMARMVHLLFPNVRVIYQLFDRGNWVFPPGFADLLQEQVNAMKYLIPEYDICKWLNEKYSFLSKEYLDWLKGIRFDPSEVKITQVGSKLSVTIEGYWESAIFWETPLMATISELYGNIMGWIPDEGFLERASYKGRLFKENGLLLSEFGARRRDSFLTHKLVLNELAKYQSSPQKPGGLVGSSDVYLAYLNNISAQGTIAHEVFMVMAGLYGYKQANTKALEAWAQTFGSNFGTALPDTFTTDVFLRSFVRKYAENYDSLRQDSGSPFWFTDKIVAHYKLLGIDPLTKTIIFSDNLDFVKAMNIAQYCIGKIKCAFGIGTWLTNDVGHPAPKWVIKITHVFVNGVWIPVIKLSDDPTKQIHTMTPLQVVDVIKELGIEEY